MSLPINVKVGYLSHGQLTLLSRFCGSLKHLQRLQVHHAILFFIILKIIQEPTQVSIFLAPPKIPRVLISVPKTDPRPRNIKIISILFKKTGKAQKLKFQNACNNPLSKKNCKNSNNLQGRIKERMRSLMRKVERAACGVGCVHLLLSNLPHNCRFWTQ